MQKELITKSAVHKMPPHHYTPYNYDINPYRGCQHRCEYCFALYSHKFLNSDNFYDDIFYKSNLIACLDKELGKKSLQNQLMGVGTVCDSYQPAEKELELTKQLWPLFIKHKTPVYLSTKSSLILRDIDYIAQLSKLVPVYIAVSIITMDEGIAKKLEPNVISPQERIQVAKTLKEKTNAYVGIHLMPIIPFITDSFENLKEIIQQAKNLNLDFATCSPLNLYSETKLHFFNFLKGSFPKVLPQISALFANSKALHEKAEQIMKLAYSAKVACNFKNKCNFAEWKTTASTQISLFE